MRSSEIFTLTNIHEVPAPVRASSERGCTMHMRRVPCRFYLFFASVVLSLLLTSAGMAHAQTKTSNVTVSGTFADENVCSGSGSVLSCIFVDVSNASSTETTPGITPFLAYDIFTTDFSTGAFQEFGGFGQISVTAFKATGATDALSVDTSTVPGFINFMASFDPTTGITTAGPAPGGLVSGTWIELPIQGSQNGTITNTFPAAKLIITGTSGFNLASASVTVLGVGATGGDAQVGTQHNTTISIQFQ